MAPEMVLKVMGKLLQDTSVRIHCSLEIWVNGTVRRETGITRNPGGTMRGRNGTMKERDGIIRNMAMII
jgi:hypothetical protein